MNYVNAKCVLPEALIVEIQKYVDGEMIYIPTKEGKRSWGQKNGTKKQYDVRNEEIRRLYRDGASVKELSEMFYLSTDSIKKIIRKSTTVPHKNIE